MFRKTPSWLPPARSTLAPFTLLSFTALVVLSGAPLAMAQTIKGAVVSTSLETTLFPQWAQDLGYRNNAPSVPRHVEERNEERYADGSQRGESF
jgi:hypothetical protein